MKRPLYGVSVMVIFLLATVRLLSAYEVTWPTFGKSPERTKSKLADEERYGPYKDKPLEELWNIRKEFFKSGRVPIEAKEIKRLQQLYRAMDEKDPTFRSKTPIEFYGRVTDQYGKPVFGAVVDMMWGKGTNCVISTPDSGEFKFSGQTGKSLDVYVHKPGYVVCRDSRKVFQYSDFFDPHFHLPNPTNPVLFRLQKLEGPEPMYVCSLRPKIDVAGTAVWVDVSSGKKGETGDVGFSVVRDSIVAEETPGYTLSILTPSGGGVIVTNEEFMFHAPVTGYSARIQVRQGPSGPNDPIGQSPTELKLYLKTVDNKYAAIEVNVGQFARPEAWVDLVICFNPSGSRNLEMGPVRLDARQVKALRGATRDEIGPKDKVKH